MPVRCTRAPNAPPSRTRERTPSAPTTRSKRSVTWPPSLESVTVPSCIARMSVVPKRVVMLGSPSKASTSSSCKRDRVTTARRAPFGGAASVRPRASTTRTPGNSRASPSAGPRPRASSTARPFAASESPAPIGAAAATRSTMVTLAPERANSKAVAAPPVAAPTTSTFRFVSCISPSGKRTPSNCPSRAPGAVTVPDSDMTACDTSRRTRAQRLRLRRGGIAAKLSS